MHIFVYIEYRSDFPARKFISSAFHGMKIKTIMKHSDQGRDNYLQMLVHASSIIILFIHKTKFKYS